MDGSGAGAISLDESQPIEGTVLTKCLKLDAGQASVGHRIGIANDGYWGIPVKPKTSYRASFYAKANNSGGNPLTVSIESNDGAKVFATAQVPGINDQWQRYTATLTTGDDVIPSAATRFVISTEKPGTIWFNLISSVSAHFQRPSQWKPYRYHATTFRYEAGFPPAAGR